MPIQWWGYLHKEGTFHVKRFFSQQDIDEAVLSPFVSQVAGPWDCNSREEAIEKLKKDLEA